MKNFIIGLLCCILILFVTINSNKISKYITRIITNNYKLIIEDKNEYANDYGFAYVDLNEEYIPYSYDDINDIIYTVINNGWDTFTFYCPSEYTNCLKDFESISNDGLGLSYINNFVHPFNSFYELHTVYYTSGQITLEIKHLYNDKQIKEINTEVDRIIGLIIKDKQTDYEKIKTIHDYIINNTKYNDKVDENNNSIYFTAYNVLFDHYGTCNGYTDLMAIFLDKLGIKNYKIAVPKENISANEEKGHIWNAAYVDGKWLHLDLTWDDPVSSSGEDYLYHKYFLVTNEELSSADAGEVTIMEHNFNKNIYLEFNEKYQKLN